VHRQSKAVSAECDVDLSSAVVKYRPAAAEEQSISAEKVSPVPLFDAAPWRTFRWYFGKYGPAANPVRSPRTVAPTPK
jgi:hypothetical protein